MVHPQAKRRMKKDPYTDLFFITISINQKRDERYIIRDALNCLIGILKKRKIPYFPQITILGFAKTTSIAIETDHTEHRKVQEEYRGFNISKGPHFPTIMVFSWQSMGKGLDDNEYFCLLYTSPSPRD